MLSTNNAALYAGLAAGSSAIKSWGSTITSSTSSVFQKMRALTIGAFAAGAAGAVTYWHKANESIKELAATGRTANSLGIASDQFMGLQNNAKKFGLEAGDVTSALVKLGAHMEGGGKGAESFKKKLADIGVETDGKSIDQVFLDISDAIKKLPDPAKQAAAAVDIFSKQGVALLPVMQQGKKAIEEFIAAQKAKGLLISPDEMKNLQRVRAEIPRLQLTWDALWNKVLIASLPVLEMINTKLSDGLARLGPALNKIGEAAEGAFSATAVGVTATVGVVEQMIDVIGRSTGAWQENELATMHWGDVSFGMFAVAAHWAAHLYDGIKALGGAIVFIEGSFIRGLNFISDAFVKFFELLEKIPEQFMGDLTKGMLKSAKDSAQSTSDWLTKTGANMQAGGADLIKNFGDSAKAVDKLTDKMLDKRIADRMAPKKDPGFVGPMMPEIKAPDYSPAGLGIKGSKEDYEIKTRFAVSGMMDKTADKQLQEMQKINGVLVQNLPVLQDINKSLSENRDTLGVV